MGRLNESRMGAVITEAHAVSLSRSLGSTLHARHGTTVLLALDGDVTVTCPGAPPVRARAVLVPPDVLHAVACPGPVLSFLFDPEEEPRVAGNARARGAPTPVDPHLAARLASAVGAHRASLPRPDVLGGLARESAAWLAEGAPRRPVDRRVAQALEALRDPTLEEDLAVPGVSDAHLRALFVRDVGLPIRTFRLWRRALTALAAFSRIDATSAAHLAGFADLAHFSRTCRRMFGGSPTELGAALLTA